MQITTEPTIESRTEQPYMGGTPVDTVTGPLHVDDAAAHRPDAMRS